MLPITCLNVPYFTTMLSHLFVFEICETVNIRRETFLIFDKNKGIICASYKMVKSILIGNQKEL